ncbi:MAG: hypothetical protein MJZ76_08835 [Bacteroidales bacterium]|nr:hypothetical protein [Bacteroidales bacterium]
MKRNFMFAFLLFIGMLSMAQNVVVQTTNNPSRSAQDDCAFRINGICSTEDIGGVDVQIIYQSFNSNSGEYYKNYATIDGYLGEGGTNAILLENYHDFPVSVYLLIGNNDQCEDKVFSMVLKAHAQKMFYPGGCDYTDYRYLKGIITKKI